MEADSELTPAEIDHMLLKKMRPDGLVNLDPDVISRLDGRLEKTSLVIPVGVKKDGTCTAASSVAPPMADKRALPVCIRKAGRIRQADPGRADPGKTLQEEAGDGLRLLRFFPSVRI